MDEKRPIAWIGPHGPPIPEPPCGFDGQKCVHLTETDWRSLVICTVSGIVLIVAIGLVSRHYRYEHKLACLLWKVDIREVVINMTSESMNDNGEAVLIAPGSNVVTRRSLLMTFGQHGANNNNCSNGSLGPASSVKQGDSTVTNSRGSSGADLGLKRTFTRTGVYRANIVAIKAISHKPVDLTRSIRKELKQMTEVRHENVVPFIGASVEYAGVFILTSYCARGSLEDVLQNRDFKLDTIFIASLVADLIKVIVHVENVRSWVT